MLLKFILVYTVNPHILKIIRIDELLEEKKRNDQELVQSNPIFCHYNKIGGNGSKIKTDYRNMNYKDRLHRVNSTYGKPGEQLFTQSGHLVTELDVSAHTKGDNDINNQQQRISLQKDHLGTVKSINLIFSFCSGSKHSFICSHPHVSMNLHGHDFILG